MRSDSRLINKKKRGWGRRREREKEACLQERVLRGRPKLSGGLRTEYLSFRRITVLPRGDIILKGS